MARIVYLVSHYPTVHHTFVLREIVGLRALDHEIEVVAIRGDDRPIDTVTDIEREERARTRTILPLNLDFVRAHVACLASRPLRYFQGLHFALRLAKWNIRSASRNLIYFAEAIAVGGLVRRLHAHHVHTHFSSTVLLIAHRVFDFTISMTIHGSGEFEDAVGFHMREKLAAARLVVAISDFGKSQIMRSCDARDWDKIEVCRLGVDPTQFSRGGARGERDTHRLITVGRLVPVKGYRLLIDAVAMLVRRGHRLRLRIVGAGPEKEALAERISSNGLVDVVTLDGPKTQPELLKLYCESDVCVLASFAEGVPVVLMEAMAFEVPCVATWVAGVPELITHEVDGLLVVPGNVAKLADCIERLLVSPEFSLRLGLEARRKIEALYDIRENVRKLSAVFQQRIS